jgi:hypothetical protein
MLISWLLLVGWDGKLVLVLGWHGREKPEGVEISQNGAMRTGTDQEELRKWFFDEYLEKSLAIGSIVPAPQVEVVPGGIKAAQSMLDKLKAGVSGKKLVVSFGCGHNRVACIVEKIE